MSAVRWLSGSARLGLLLLGSLLAWVVIAPVAALVPKRHDWVAVIGRQHGRFLDNAKYFFVQARASAPQFRVVFVTEVPNVSALFDTNSHESIRYPSPPAIWFLMRCGTAVVDSMDWTQHLRRFLLIRAHVLQLWHGVGFKRIERDRWRHEVGRARLLSAPWMFAARLLVYRVTGRVVRYGAVNTTSAFYRDEVFIPAFLSNHYLVAGYPRNTFGSTSANDRILTWANVDVGIKRGMDAWKHSGRRLVVVAPTVRDSGATPVQLDDRTMQRIDAFAGTHGVEFIFKFHPSETGGNLLRGSHLHLCSPDSDLYPVLGWADALVTDYSSIYMDFLLVDRPVLFLIPDGDRYMREDREVQFNLADMMPGPVVATWEELLGALVAQWQTDTFREERARLRRKAFDDLPQDEATPKLISFMRDEGWLQ